MKHISSLQPGNDTITNTKIDHLLKIITFMQTHILQQRECFTGHQESSLPDNEHAKDDEGGLADYITSKMDWSRLVYNILERLNSGEK